MVNSCCQGMYDILLYKAIFSLMYFGCLRISETVVTDNKKEHTLKVHDVMPLYKDRCLVGFRLTLHTYKFNYQKPVVMKLCPASEVDKCICPVQALAKYLLMRGNGNGVLFLDSSGVNITRSVVSVKLKEILLRLSLDADLYNTHSFRIGRATDLILSGVSTENVRLIGRWSSDAFRKYIRPSLVVLP